MKSQEIAALLRAAYYYHEIVTKGMSTDFLQNDFADVKLPTSSECASLHFLSTTFPFFGIATMLTTGVTLKQLISFAESLMSFQKLHKQVLLYLPHWSHWCRILFMNHKTFQNLGNVTVSIIFNSLSFP